MTAAIGFYENKFIFQSFKILILNSGIHYMETSQVKSLNTFAMISQRRGCDIRYLFLKKRSILRTFASQETALQKSWPVLQLANSFFGLALLGLV
ncbi:hypothetical protein HZY91_08200 [Facklamia sp. DSM 111018]|uniref:Uncharacterized protein n=1 Tax=Facklamia lactis TaxID=2749967 RepID=A0ABS0LU17_9LACT|nr:hypothetical protein [Facklamia lactis]